MKDRYQSKILKFIFAFDIVFLIGYLIYFLRIKYIFISNVTHQAETWQSVDIFRTHYKAVIILVLVWILAASFIKLYSKKYFDQFLVQFRNLFFQFVFFGIVLLAISGLKEEDLLEPFSSCLYLLLFFISSLIVRFIAIQIMAYFIRKGYVSQNIAVLGYNSNTMKFIQHFLNDNQCGIIFKGLITDKVFPREQVFPVFRSHNFDIENFIQKEDISQLFIAQMSNIPSEILDKIILYCSRNHIEILYIPYSQSSDFTRLEVEYIDTLPILKIKNFPLDIPVNQIIKELFDKIFALFVCLFLLSWLFPIIAFIIYVDSGRPIFFTQKRTGLNGRKFNCIKFRTMIQTNTNSIIETKRNDKRITRVGHFLRKSSLDELPQFFNVLKGDMSIVGPRPHMIVQDVYYDEVIEKYFLRHYVKPGITGLAQVKGFRGAIDCDADMEKRINADLYYVRNWSFLLDVKIVVQTIWLTIRGDENAI